MLEIAICDDSQEFNKIFINKVKQILNPTQIKFNISDFYSAKELLNSMNTCSYNIVFLDIQFKNSTYTGIDLAKKINLLYPTTLIIFISGIKDYFIDVYDANHVFFILKDNLDETLSKSLTLALKKIENDQKKKFISISFNGETFVVLQSKIIYVENILRKVKFHTLGNDYFTYSNFDQTQTNLDHEDFVRCHRSFIINLRNIKKIAKNEIITIDDCVVPIGRYYKKNLMTKLFQQDIPQDKY